jgi:hypothetical protein
MLKFSSGGANSYRNIPPDEPAASATRMRELASIIAGFEERLWVRRRDGQGHFGSQGAESHSSQDANQRWSQSLALDGWDDTSFLVCGLCVNWTP